MNILGIDIGGSGVKVRRWIPNRVYCWQDVSGDLRLRARNPEDIAKVVRKLPPILNGGSHRLWFPRCHPTWRCQNRSECA